MMKRIGLSRELTLIMLNNRIIDIKNFFRKNAWIVFPVAILGGGNQFADFPQKNESEKQAVSTETDIATAQPPKFDPSIVKRTQADGIGDTGDKRLYEHISERYRIAKEPARFIVISVLKQSQRYHVDPMTMLAVIAQESRFNPIAESFTGAAGFSQVQPAAHPEKIASIKENGHILSMDDNIVIGTRILGEYLKKFHGNYEKALQQYNGNLHDKQKKYYRKVMKIREELVFVKSGTSVAASSQTGKTGTRNDTGMVQAKSFEDKTQKKS